MFKNYIPDQICDNFSQIDFRYLISNGYRNLIIDVDNTIIKIDEIIVNDKTKRTIQIARNHGIKEICLLSNVGIRSNRKIKRINSIAEQLNVDYYICAFWPRIKPHPEPFNKALGSMENATIDNTAVIGDQILSDIVGGNKLGFYTILVKPLGPDHPITFWKRWLEKILIKRFY